MGVEAFGALRAEHEPWLMRCFVPPPEFERVIGPESVIVFGRVGTGKTALARALREHSRLEGYLTLDWHPAPDASPGGSRAPSPIYGQFDHLLDACARALANFLAREPGAWAGAPEWARARVVWFLHTCTAGALGVRLGPLLEGDSAGAALLREIVSQSPREILYPNAPRDQIIAELMSAVLGLGLKGIWVLVEGVERWFHVHREGMSALMRAFLDTLPLFERPEMAFKVFAPADMEPVLSGAGGLLRRRLNAYRLRWDEERLRHIVEVRLGAVLGADRFPLERLCSDPHLLTWLRRVGAESPREWLTQVRPLLERYVEKGGRAPVDGQEWRELRRKYPPRLHLDEQRGRVLVGAREIPVSRLPAKAYEMLKYLYYERPGQVVSKAELYFRFYRNRDSVPRSPEDEEYEFHKEFESVMDTTLWRLRRAIEPDPSDPVLLVTVRGHGVRLMVRW